MRDKFSDHINFSNANEKRDVLTLIGRLQGPYRVSIEPERAGRSGQQNRYYHSCFVRPLYDYLRDPKWERPWNGTQDDAHMLIRAKCLPRVVADPDTGEILATIPGSTRKLTVVEFTDFLEHAREWLDSAFGIIVPEAQIDYERRSA